MNYFRNFLVGLFLLIFVFVIINYNSMIYKVFNNKYTSYSHTVKKLIKLPSAIPKTTENFERSKLTNTLYNFQWELLLKAVQIRDEKLKTYYLEDLMNKLQDFNNQEPEVIINATCQPPALVNTNKIRCENYPAAFLPKRNPRPVKVAHAVQLGFDVDSLEIHLNEVYDVIDYFFIIEATKSHCVGNRKRLTWVEVSKQKRFAKFREKMVHLIIDEADEAEIGKQIFAKWGLEGLQERLRWEKILKWHSYTNVFTDDDIIGFGDADEVPSRRNIQLFKHCAFKPGSVDIGIWFPFGRMDQAYKSDFPVKNHAYTLGDPTFYRWKDIIKPLKKDKFPNRQRGKSANYLLGGCHLTNYGFLPQALLKTITSSECGSFTVNGLEKAITNHLKKGLDKNGIPKLDALIHMEEFFQKRHRYFNKRIFFLKDIKEDISDIVIEPWFYACNRDRYPSWEGKHDTRVF